MMDFSTPKLAVLVNSCDKFEDCWHPFFVLWKKFGIKSLDHAVYLNTEWRTFTEPDVSVHSLQVCAANDWKRQKPPTWSWCLAKALDAIPEEFVLYLQEDYFLQSQINESALRLVLHQMDEHPEIGCVHLTNIGIRTTLPASEFAGLKKGNPRDWYYASCQTAVWRKKTLAAILREHEDAWQFERWASKRARLMGLAFYVFDEVDQDNPVDYIRTGVVQGKWFAPVVGLFREHGIKMDFLKRGFYEGKYGRKQGRRLAWAWTWLRYNVRAALFRYVLPLKSLRDIAGMSLSQQTKNDKHGPA